MKVTTFLHLVLELRIHGTIPPFSHITSWDSKGRTYLFYLHIGLATALINKLNVVTKV
jgi:hypothetical protein